MLENFLCFLTSLILAFILTLNVKEKWSPIERGTLVRTTKPNWKKRKDWTDEGWNGRQWGIQGKVLIHHDAHGLYYEVIHPDETVGYYDPSELKVVE